MKKNNTLKTKLEYYFSSTCGIYSFLTEIFSSSRKYSKFYVGWHRNWLYQDCAFILLRFVRLQRVELSQLCHRRAAGPGQEPSSGYRDLHHPRDGGLHHDQHCILHHTQCTWSSRFRSCCCGEKICFLWVLVVSVMINFRSSQFLLSSK